MLSSMAMRLSALALQPSTQSAGCPLQGVGKTAWSQWNGRRRDPLPRSAAAALPPPLPAGRRQPARGPSVAAAATAPGNGDSSATGPDLSSSSPQDLEWQQQEMQQMVAGWAELAPDEREWLEAQNAALSLQPGSVEAAQQQQERLQDLANRWNAFPAVKQWSTAWADLLPHQQQQTLQQYGVGSREELLAAAAAEFLSVAEDQRAEHLAGMPTPAARLLVAAANVQQQGERQAGWAELAPDERDWLEAQDAAMAAAAAAELNSLAKQWNAWPVDKRWRTAWADLLPSQQQQLLSKYGAAGQQELAPAAAAALAAVPPEQQMAWLGQLPILEQRVVAAAAGLQQEAQMAGEVQQQRAAWAGLSPADREWLESLHAALEVQPATQAEAEEQQRQLQQLGEAWNVLPAGRQWATAWANLLPSQQQQLLAKYGAAGQHELVAAAAAAYAAAGPEQRAGWLAQLPAAEAQLLVASANVQKQQALLQQQLQEREAGWAALPEDEQQWLQAQQVVLTAAPQGQQEADAQGRSLQKLIEQWNGWPADKQWRTAWADLLPLQQQQLLTKYGASAPEAVQAAAAALLGALPSEERAELQAQMPPYEERVVVAASNLRRSMGAS